MASDNRVFFIEIEGLECVGGHVVRRHYGESKW